MPNNKVSLSISGRDYYGWTDVKIIVSLQSFARSFEMSLTAKTEESKSGAFRIKSGESVDVRIGAEKVLSGYVVEVSESYSATNHQIRIKGNSKTVDLIDCCIPDGCALSYKQQTPGDIIKTVAAYYGIGFVSEIVKIDKINADFSAEEKIKSGFEKIIKKNSLLLTDDEQGRLVLVFAGSGGYCNDSISVGHNVLSGYRSVNASGLYSRYVILGQGANPLSQRPLKDLQLKEVAEDSDIRKRVLTILQSGDAVATEMQTRVSIYKDFSQAESETLQYTLRGWRQTNGDLWPVNSFVTVKDSVLGVAKEYLITSVTYSLTASGMTSTLELKSPKAFLDTAQATVQEAVKNLSVTGIGSVAKASWTSK